MPRVVLSYQGLKVRGYELTRERTVIGRRSDSDIQLDDPAVSGRHAVMLLQPNAYLDDYFDVIVEDCGSTNGTLVNGEKVRRHTLRHGDTIRMGRHEFLFDADSGFAPEHTTVYLPDSDLR